MLPIKIKAYKGVAAQTLQQAVSVSPGHIGVKTVGLAVKHAHSISLRC